MKYQVKKGLGATVKRGGVEFRVWAPFAKSVQVVATYYENEGVHLKNENDGYWSAFVKNIGPGYAYQYLIEAADGRLLRRIDPRARVVTAAEGGMSVVPDNDFDWGDDLFMPIPKEKQVYYELHIGTFNRADASTYGTFYDAIDKLDYLAELGVNMIELMPVTTSASEHGWGYSVSHLFSVEPLYGGRRGLMEFVKAAHTHGIGVILDVVYNHFALTDLYQFDGWSENDRGGIYFYNDRRGDTPWGARPDYGRAEVRQFLLDNMVMWLSEYRLDGLRLDSTIYMRNIEGKNDDPENDLPDAWKLLGDMTNLAHKINPGATMIAEDCSVNEYLTKSVNDGGCGFDAQWGLNFPHGIRGISGLPIPFSVNFYDELQSKYNNDAFQKVIFTDSHDTAANGQNRLNEAITPGNAESALARERTLLTTAVTLSAPGIPLLLQGQEFMQEGEFSDWRVLEWAKTEQFAGIVQAYRDLIGLRLNRDGQTAGLAGQSVSFFHRDDNNTVLGYHRWDQGGPGDDTLVIVNFGGNKFSDYEIWLPLAGTWRVRFNSSWRGYSPDFPEAEVDKVVTDSNQKVNLPLAPFCVLILSQD